MKISIYSYLDYQIFLKDYYENRKKMDSFFSYRFMGQKLRMDPGFLAKVLNGKMHVPEKSIAKITKFINLGNRESQYFSLLVKYGRSKTPQNIQKYFEKLCEFKRGAFSKLKASQFLFFQKWYHSAIWNLIHLKPFSGDYKSLVKQLTPKITEAQAKESITLLSKIGLIQKNVGGKYSATENYITTGEKWSSTAVRNFQMETLDLAKESLSNQPASIRDISTVSISVSNKDFEEIKIRAKEFRRSLMQLKTENQNEDSVYQVNIQIFPLANVDGKFK